MPRGPRRNLRPVPVSMSHPSAATSMGNCPTAWVASSRNRVSAVACDATDLGGGVHEAACRRHPRQADQLRALVDETGKRVEVDLSAFVVGDDDHVGSGPRGDLEVGEHAAAVLVAPGQDSVAFRQRDRVERGIPCVRGVVEERDLLRRCAEQFTERPVGVVDPVGGRLCRFVAADLGLELQLMRHRRDRRRAEQGGARIVEVIAVQAARGGGAQFSDVHPVRAHLPEVKADWNHAGIARG